MFYNWLGGVYMRSNLEVVNNKAVNEETLVDVYFFAKKKFLEHKTISSSSMSEVKDFLLKSYMVVFVAKSGTKDIMLKELEMFCRKYNNYGPIVSMNGSEIIYFPQLRYQDGFLIKNIFENILKNEKFDVMFGNVII